MWFKEKDIIMKMSREDGIFNKIKKKIFKMKGYRIKVGENGYILFKKEEDYLNLFCLDKAFFEFYNNLFLDKEGIRLFVRLSLIEKCIESLTKNKNKFRIRFKILYDEYKSENLLEMKFPDMTCVGHWDIEQKVFDKIKEMEEMKKLENIPLEKKYMSIKIKMEQLIDVKYFKRDMGFHYELWGIS